MAQVIGLTLAKINGRFHVDVSGSRWDVRRGVQQHTTGGGIKSATGEAMASGSFDQVIPKQADLDWAALTDFSVEIYDKETRSIVIAAFEECNWNSVGGNSDNAGANTRKAIAWVANRAIKY